MNMDTPKRQLKAVFFYSGKNFCLRGGAEQRGLKISQLCREVVQIGGRDVCSYIYHEFGSKNGQGGFNTLNSDNKSVRQYENTSGDICHVRILNMYLKKIPNEARSADNFYRTPVTVLPSDPSKPWFTKVPVGKNTLNKMLKEMCLEAGLPDIHTYHSLRAYGASTLFQGKVPEKIMQQRIGHKSLNSSRQYERTTEAQLLDVSNVLSNNIKLKTAAPVAPQGDYETAAVAFTQGDVYSANSSNVMFQSKSFRKPVAATMILRGCNFANCNIAFSGSVGDENSCGSCNQDDLLEGISIKQLYED